MNWLRRFMDGRYGPDQLTIGLLGLYLLVWLIERLFGWYFLMLLTAAIVIYAFFRILSRNLEKRRAENEKFLLFYQWAKSLFQGRKNKFTGSMSKKAGAIKDFSIPIKEKTETIQQRITERKTHKRFHCPNCSQELRVPKGKGKIKIHCPKCSMDFIKKT